MEPNYDIPHSKNEEEDIHQQEMLRRNPARILKPGDPDFERIAKEIMENQQNDKKTPPPKKSSTKKTIVCKSCGKKALHKSRGLCSMCYSAEFEAGTLDKNYPRSKRHNGKSPSICEECGELKHLLARGMCQTCYKRTYYHENKNKGATPAEKAKTATTQRVEQAKENLRKNMDRKKEDRAQSRAGTAHQTTGPAPDAHATTPEPPPEQNSAEPVYKRLVNAIQERAEMGQQKYGTHLQPHNGRNALVDALQESLDMNMYQMQYIIELENKRATIRHAVGEVQV